MSRSIALVALMLLVSACGSETVDPAGGPDADATPATPSGVVFTQATVLESGDQGPQLCLGGVAESYPPQCGGPRLIGWDWREVGGFERASGTTWGDYVVFGTYEPAKDAFTLDRRAVPAAEYDGPSPRAEADEPRGTPCDEPGGGWQVLDPSLTTEESLIEVQRTAARLPGYSEFWYDQSINPAYGTEDPAEMESLMNDPERLVVNVSVTGDVVGAEAALREVWGGALCVSSVRYTSEELQQIQDEVMDVDGMLGVGSGRDRVDLTVVYDDGSLQESVDEQYGEDVVRVTSVLQPYPG